MTTADAIIAKLNLAPHPEGGYYRETWKADNDGRPVGTAIYFLLKAGECSHWHTVDADEIWIYNAGAPITLSTSASDNGPAQDDTLGPDVLAGQNPQIIVPTSHWQTAKTNGDWSLVTCTVSPGFTFDGFYLADADFDIPRR